MQAKALVLALSVALTGCQTRDDIEVEPPPPLAGANHALQVREIVDLKYESDAKAIRERLALDYLKRHCPAGRVVKESVIETGTDNLGRRTRNYTLYVKC